MMGEQLVLDAEAGREDRSRHPVREQAKPLGRAGGLGEAAGQLGGSKLRGLIFPFDADTRHFENILLLKPFTGRAQACARRAERTVNSPVMLSGMEDQPPGGDNNKAVGRP
jgi:hypothetical protein